MLCGIIIATLLIASIGTLGAQAEGNEEVTAKPNGYHGIVLGALTVNKDNKFVSGPDDKNVYGSEVQMKNNVFDSSNTFERSDTGTLTVIAPGGPGHEGIAYVWTGDGWLQQHQAPGKWVVVGAVTIQKGNTFSSEPGSENIYGSRVEQAGNVYRIHGSPSITLGAVTVQEGNHFSTSAGSKNYFGSRLTQEGNVYDFSYSEDKAPNTNNS